MNENKNIPQLFRDIFRGVFLPYRDPETLNLFLKTIDGFTYDHSERLGDAYEYLLNVLGTQGDAGQFRTPRHIIDFIATAVDPQKHETILDPACGTAGFLISAYKHILKHNENLSPDERARLMTNFCGYDIAPDMGRLSRVNLYLHGFREPVIHEYDALTSEERWDERYDVIMANPPFMTPTGGIRPHKRFSITATRSEVLFLDYIAEHLNPKGRAGIIVPEGIIFQGQTAYKKLRRMLVENYLWAVVSLPAGVFNPYSGVKTSILLLDRNLARRTDNVLFVKISYDGFDLGAQRRPIDTNDLPEALEILIDHTQGQKTPENGMSLCVSRKRLLDNPDCNLSSDRYRTATIRSSAKWPMMTLGELLRSVKYSPKVLKSDFLKRGRYPIIDQSENFIAGYWNNEDAVFHVDTPLILFGDHTRSVKYVDFDFVLGADGVKILLADERMSPRYLYHCLNYIEVPNLGYSRHFKELVRLEIPLPPLEEQDRIVAELEGYRKIIEGARQVIANYKPAIRSDPCWPTVLLGDVAEFKNGINYSAQNRGEGMSVVGVRHFQNNVVAPLEDLDSVNPAGIVTKEDFLQDRDLLFVRSNGNPELVGRCLLIRTNGRKLTHSAFTIRARLDADRFEPEFYAYLFRTPAFREALLGRGANISNLTQSKLAELSIPVPSIEEQRKILLGLSDERALVESNRKLVHIFETKTQAKLDEIWGITEEVTANDPKESEIEEQDTAEYSVPAGGFSTT